MAKDKKSARKKTTDAGQASSSKPDGHLSKADYLAELEPLELALNNLARWLQHTGRRLVVVFEGRDTAGKCGAISRGVGKVGGAVGVVGGAVGGVVGGAVGGGVGLPVRA